MICDKEWLPLQRYNVQLCCIVYVVSYICYLRSFSEEDITSVKASFYYLKAMLKSSQYFDLFKVAVQLVLLTTSRVLCNKKISDDIIKDVTDKVKNSLKDLMKSGTTKMCKNSIFNVQHKIQGPLEAKVWRNLYEYNNNILYLVLDRNAQL